MRALLASVWLASTGCGGAPDTRGEGAVCGVQTDCAEGLVCAHDAVCRADGRPGTTLAGEACDATAACSVDLVCSGAGACVEVGAPQTALPGEVCSVDDDCRAGLTCPEGVCIGVEVPYWPGLVCPTFPEDRGSFRALFEVPGEAPVEEFYRLPYPNDARLNDRREADLIGHPLADVPVPAWGDLTGPISTTASFGSDGFSGSQTVFFRTTELVPAAQLRPGGPGDGNVWVVDVTPNDDAFGTLFPAEVVSSGDPGRFFCGPWIAVHPPLGASWRANHTYAVLLSAEITDEAGTRALQADADLREVLRPELPADARLDPTWRAYAPLRSWLDDEGIAPEQIAAASVLTIADSVGYGSALQVQTTLQPIPSSTALTACDASTPDVVGCATTDPDATGFIEVHATLTLPQYQEGSPPYRLPTDGGGIEIRDPTPDPVGEAAVEVVVTLPVGPPPPNGWPWALILHDGGADATSFVRDGLAAALAAPGGGAPPIAAISFDLPLHGRRAALGGGDGALLAIDPTAFLPESVFVNVLHPRAARDNTQQAASEAWEILRWVDSLTGAPVSAGGVPLRLDPTQVLLLGQGVSAPAAIEVTVHAPAIRALAVTNAPGTWIDVALHQERPWPTLPLLRAAFADPSLTRVHPVLNLWQQVMERGDAVAHAPHVLTAPRPGDAARPVLAVVGHGDPRWGDAAMTSVVASLGLSQAPVAGADPLEGVPQIALPASGNVDGTTGVALVLPPSSSPETTLVDAPGVLAAVRAFFANALEGPAPVVSLPAG
jgi:hypothetical protein